MPELVISDFEYKVWWSPSQADADDCWLGVANSIASGVIALN
jgi:hypothetical protein